VTVEQAITWGILLAVLGAISLGRFRMEVVALGGLLLLGLGGIAPASVIFSGFGHPALATIVAVFFISQGIINSGVMRGLGQSLAKRAKSSRGQIIELSALAAFLSAFMNNVGAVGLMLPTAVRMAKRCGSSPGTFGLPLAFASILGGTLTLIGSAPNIIIASFMASATGSPFKMFDYFPHGAAMLAVFFLLWIFCKSCGLDPGNENEAAGEKADSAVPGQDRTSLDEVIHFAPLATRERRVTLLAILPAIGLVSFGLIHPAFGFGAAAVVLIIGGVLKPPAAYESVDIKIVFFLGAMLGIGQTLEHTGALAVVSDLLVGLTGSLSPFWLILLLVFAASALSNGINNAAAAVFMAPLAIGMAGGSTMETAAALMAVAAGSNLTLLLPTHQATLMVISKAPFSTGFFIKFGAVLTICCGLAATAVIYLVWQ
jgi:di/tricarboxylate transporter